MRESTGRVVRFGDRGWGFIRPDDGGQDVFVHIADVAELDRERLRQGTPVIFTLADGSRGPRAVKVSVMAGHLQDVPGWQAARPESPSSELADLLTAPEYRKELEAIIGSAVDLAVDLARKHGWVE